VLSVPHIFLVDHHVRMNQFLIPQELYQNIPRIVSLFLYRAGYSFRVYPTAYNGLEFEQNTANLHKVVWVLLVLAIQREGLDRSQKDMQPIRSRNLPEEPWQNKDVLNDRKFP
jgi:hypothetical protein